MLRKFVLLGTMALALSVSACDSKDSAATSTVPSKNDVSDAQTASTSVQKIAVVDTEAVFRDSKLAVEGLGFLDRVSSGMQARLAEMQQEMGKTPDNKDLEAKLQSELLSMQMEQDLRQRTVAEKINGLFDTALQAKRKELGVSLVLPRQLVLAGGDDVDITKDVVELMDKESVDFEALTQEAMDKAKADEAKLSGKEAEGEQAKAGGSDAAKDAKQEKGKSTKAPASKIDHNKPGDTSK